MSCFLIKDLSFSYPLSDKQVLNKINVQINQGEYVTICGKSGSGKSTLLRHLKSVLSPSGSLEGEIYFNGKLLKDVDMRTQVASIGYVLQNPDHQIVTDKVWHELAFGLESLGEDNKTIRLRVAEMASYFGIQTWFDKDVAELSGGQKQLLNLASIMAMQPSVLILDEPTSQLDPIAASDFLNTVKKINRELGTTILITEHRLEEVFPAADRVLVMDHGEIIADDTPSKVGEKLKIQKHDMFAALPAPMQIYAGVDNRLECPLTVREGRNWLNRLLDERPMEFRRAQAPLEEGDNDITKKLEKGSLAVETKGVWFKYDRASADVVKGLSLKLPKGKLSAILGGNGTGKSTTLKLIGGVVKPYRGKIYIDGKEIGKYKGSALYEKNLAVLPQNPQSLFVKEKVRDDLAEMLSGKKLGREEINKQVEAMAELVEIGHILDQHPYDISGGEQQRAALAKVLLLEPKILLLDEPTKGIDNFFKIKLARILKKLMDQGVTIIMVSHDIEFCAANADICYMFFNGDVVTMNPPHKFFSGNNFYTTAANRMSRHLMENAVTNEDVINLCKMNLI